MSDLVCAEHGSATVLGSGYVMNVVVHVEYRGKGYGVALMAEVVRQHGNRPLFLDCRRELIPFYERSGFVVAGTSTFFGMRPEYVGMMRQPDLTSVQQPVKI